MFPSWAVPRSRSAYVPCQARLIAILRQLVALFLIGGLCACGGIAAAESNVAAEPNQGESEDSAKNKLMLGVRWGDPICAAQLEQRVRGLLRATACLGDFDCQVSEEALTHAFPTPLVADGPFRDMLLNIPVQGTAHAEGELRMFPAADESRIAIDVRLDGTIRLTGSGVSHRVHITSDATVEFHAAKRLMFDGSGVTSLPASCTAETNLIFKEITSKQPKLLGKFAERVAHKLATDSEIAAETECSEHVVEAICAAFDRELGKSAAVVNAGLADYLAEASSACQAHWRAIRFRSTTDSVCITRDKDLPARFAETVAAENASSLPSIVLRLPRNTWGIGHALAGWQLLPSSPAPAATTLIRDTAPQMRSSVSVQDQLVTVSVDYDRSPRLAREPVVGAAQ